MPSFRDCAMLLEGVQQSQAQPPTCSPGMFPKPQTLLAPCFPPCSAPHPQAEGAHLSMGEACSRVWSLRGLHLTLLRLILPLPKGTSGAALVTSIPETGQ